MPTHSLAWILLQFRIIFSGGAADRNKREEREITWRQQRGGAMEKFLGALGRFVDFFDTLALALLFAALAFSVGYQMGFTSGLDTKVTWVGEKYTMKVTGNLKR